MDCVSSVVRNGEKGTNVPLMSLSMLFKRSWKYLRRFLMKDGHKEENTDHICIVAATHQQSLLQLCREEERQ
jgi:hypothetical protein